jgi:hypothetical protein
VTLAASASSNSNGGLFARHDVGALKIGSVHRYDSPALPMYMRREPNHFPLFLHYPLQKRSWVLQETLLSPRTLFFLDEEVIFECFEGMRCQYGVTDQAACTKEPELTSSTSWYDILFGYSETSPSYSRDALPALSGVRTSQALAHRASKRPIFGRIVEIIYDTRAIADCTSQEYRAPGVFGPGERLPGLEHLPQLPKKPCFSIQRAGMMCTKDKNQQ